MIKCGRKSDHLIPVSQITVNNFLTNIQICDKINRGPDGVEVQSKNCVFVKHQHLALKVGMSLVKVYCK